MHFPAEYTIVSPICFVSCKCPKSSFSLILPHAVDTSNGIDKESFKILSIITCDVNSYSVESPVTEQPLEKKLEEIYASPTVYETKLKFKASLSNPALFAVGIRNDPTARLPKPLPILRCTLFCMYEDYNEHSSISKIPVKMYVGLSIDSVRKVCH